MASALRRQVPKEPPKGLGTNFRAAALLLTGVSACSVICHCSQTIRQVPHGPHPEDASSIPVTEKPPPTKVEVIPLARRRNCRWLDGHYIWAGQAWRWQKGRWVRPPGGCYYAPPTTRYEKTERGTMLIHRPGAWFPEESGDTCVEASPCEERLQPDKRYDKALPRDGHQG